MFSYLLVNGSSWYGETILGIVANKRPIDVWINLALPQNQGLLKSKTQHLDTFAPFTLPHGIQDIYIYPSGLGHETLKHLSLSQMTPSKWEDTLLGISKATEKIRTDDVGWFIYPMLSLDRLPFQCSNSWPKWSSKMADHGQQAQLSQTHATSSFRPRILEGFLSKAQVENGWKWCKWLTDLQFSFLPFSNQTWQWETPRLVRWFSRQKKTSSFGDFQPCLMTQRRVCCSHQVYGLQNQHLTWKTGSAFHDDDRQTIISIHINHFFGDDLEMQPIFWETYEHSCCLFEMI